MVFVRKGDRVSVMGTVVGTHPDLANVKIDVLVNNAGIIQVGPLDLTLIDRRPREPDAPAVVKYGSKTYIRTVLGWILVQNEVIQGNQLRTFEQMLEWENVSFRPAIERYWAEMEAEPGHGEPF